MADFIEFPIYDGVSSDLWQWILWLEDFFILEKFTKLERLNLAQSLLAGQAEAWFYQNQKMLSSWKALRDCLWLRFGEFTDEDIQELRLEKRRKRLSRTAINPQESSSAQELIAKNESQEAKLVQVEGDTKMFQILDSSEEESIHQNQVPVSSLEPGLRFSGEIIDVSVAWPCAIVSYNPVHPQVGFESVKNTTNAHQVLDKTSAHKDRLKSKSKRMLSMSPKTWMFKFKNKNLQRQYSCSRATFGSKGNDHNFRYWRRMRQSHMSRLLCNLRVSHDHWGWGQLVLADLRSHMRHKWKSKHLRAVFDLQSSPSYALDVVNKTSKPWEKQMTFTSAYVTSVHSLSFAVGTAANWSSGLSHNSHVWEPGIGVCSSFVICVKDYSKDGTVIKTDLGKRETVHALPSQEKVLKDGDVITFGTGSATYRWSSTPLVFYFCSSSETFMVDKSVHAPVSSIGAHISPTLSEECTHVLLELRMQVNEALVNAILAKKPIILTNWVKLLAEKCICIGILGYSQYRPSVVVVQALLDVVTKPVTEGKTTVAIFQLVLERTVFHDWHRWKHKIASVTSNDRVIAAAIGRQAVLEQITKGVRHALLHNQLFAIVADNINTLPRKSATSSSMLTVLRVLCVLGTLFWSTSFKKKKFGKNWWYKFKHGLWQRECYNDVGRREFLILWRTHDSVDNSWMLSKAFVSLYPTFKLEDKLIFQGRSIDMNHQAYQRKNKKKMAVEVDVVTGLLDLKEALG